MSLEQWQQRGVEVTHTRRDYAAGRWGALSWSMTRYDGAWEATGAIPGVGNEVATGPTQSEALTTLIRLLAGRLSISMARMRAQQQLMAGVTPTPSPAHLAVLRAMPSGNMMTLRDIAARAGYSHTHVATLIGELQALGLLDANNNPTREGNEMIALMESD